MAEPKTKKTDASVADFIAAVPDAKKRSDAETVDSLLQRLTGEKPAMWGPSIVGYGEAPVVYSNGKSMDWPICGFSPRKTNFVIYLPGGYEQQTDLLEKLGPHTTGVSCLYIKRLSNIDVDVLEAIIKRAIEPHLA